LKQIPIGYWLLVYWSADVVSLMEFESGAVKVLQDFTGDRELLLTAISKLFTEQQSLDEDAGDDSPADTGAAFGQDDAEFNIFNTDRQLSALQTAVGMLGTLKGEEGAGLLCQRSAAQRSR
jgi:hypothetical protein